MFVIIFLRKPFQTSSLFKVVLTRGSRSYGVWTGNKAAAWAIAAS